MALLIFGVALWSAAHLLPSLGSNARAALIGRLGVGPYKGLFSLTLIAAITSMALGWRSTPPASIYAPPVSSAAVSYVLMFIALLLFFASGVPTNLKRVLRHPQLTGVAVWAASHLLTNGTERAVILFGGLGVWAVATTVCINRRDGAWVKPEPVPMSAEIKPLVAAIVGFALIFFAHPWLSGVALSAG